MQYNKFIKNTSEVNEYSSDSNILLKTFENIVGHFPLTQVNKWLNKAKTEKNICQLIHSGYETKLNYDKDVLYYFPKNEWVDCGKILTNFSRQFLKITN